MGIFIYLHISKSVTKPEWEKVYEKTLVLLKNLPFAESKCVDIHGVEIYCYVKSEEHTFPAIYNGSGKSWEREERGEVIGWTTNYEIPGALKHAVSGSCHKADSGKVL